MPTKQIKITMQAQPSGAEDLTFQVKIDGNTVYNQTVPATGPAQQGLTDPSETITFDFDVAASNTARATENHTFSFIATNGAAKIETIAANFSAVNETVGDVVNFVPGTANTFVVCNIVTQPEWDGQAILDRYDISYNNGPNQVTGPGEVMMYDGETVVFDVAVTNYNDSAPA